MQGGTWQQAVQWIEECQVQAGNTLEVTASHDTYSISFALGLTGQQECNDEPGESAHPIAALPKHTGVPLKVRTWQPCLS